jgi:hypothetical protein
MHIFLPTGRGTAVTSPVIFLEYNELNVDLMDRFIDQGFLPNFKRLRDSSIVCTSDAEEEPPILEPWVSWVSVHTGLPLSEHGVRDLDDGPKLKVQRSWDVLADAGKSSLVCGSMNASANTTQLDKLFLLPDPWCRIDPHPAGIFDDFFPFIRTHVQEHYRESVPLTFADYFKFGRFMLMNGMSAKTAFAIARQLVLEKFGKASRWQRAVILDRLLWDVFRHFYVRLKPDFATFFLNSVAHYQHYFWRSMEPEAFQIKDSAERQAECSGAILFGYRKMDELLGECLDLVGPEATIILGTGLTQRPLVRFEAEGGKLTHRVIDYATLTAFAGIEAPWEFSPVMAEEFYLIFKSEAEATDAAARLQALRMDDGREVMKIRQKGDRLFCGCRIYQAPAADARVVSPRLDQSRPFREMFYPLDDLKSGGHHPDGILWFRLPSTVPHQVSRKISIREIAPTLVELCGVSSAGRFPLPPIPEIVSPDDHHRPETKLAA